MGPVGGEIPNGPALKTKMRKRSSVGDGTLCPSTSQVKNHISPPSPPLAEQPTVARLAELAEAVNAALALIDQLGLIVTTPSEAVAVQLDEIRKRRLAETIQQTCVKLNMAGIRVGC